MITARVRDAEKVVVVFQHFIQVYRIEHNSVNCLIYFCFVVHVYFYLYSFVRSVCTSNCVNFIVKLHRAFGAHLLIFLVCNTQFSLVFRSLELLSVAVR